MAVSFIIISKYYRNLLGIFVKARFTDCVSGDYYCTVNLVIHVDLRNGVVLFVTV